VSAAAIATVGVFVLAISVLAQRDADRLGKVVYVQDGNLWVKVLPDGKPHQLTDDGTNSYPRWSSSGEWLSSTHGSIGGGGEIRVMHTDGTSTRRLDIADFLMGQ
jgi:Tol biopolymer transport system component